MLGDLLSFWVADASDIDMPQGVGWAGFDGAGFGRAASVNQHGVLASHGVSHLGEFDASSVLRVFDLDPVRAAQHFHLVLRTQPSQNRLKAFTAQTPTDLKVVDRLVVIDKSLQICLWRRFTKFGQESLAKRLIRVDGVRPHDNAPQVWVQSSRLEHRLKRVI